MTDDNKQSTIAAPESNDQPDEITEANKPEGARAKDQPKAGNILGGVQPKR